MKSKISVLIIAILFVALIVGAYFLYDSLKDKYETDRIGTFGQQTEEETEKADNSDTEASNGQSQNEDEIISSDPDEQASEETTAGKDSVSYAAPDFTVYDIDGNPVKLSSFFGKPIVLNFWASWCGPCQSEMPDFDDKYYELGDEVHFIMVNMTDGTRETVSSASEFIESKKYSFPVYYDTDIDAATTYSVYSLPTTYFINANGDLVAYVTGAISSNILDQGIDMIK